MAEDGTRPWAPSTLHLHLGFALQDRQALLTLFFFFLTSETLFQMKTQAEAQRVNQGQMAQTGRQRGCPEPPCSSFSLSQVEGLCALQSVVGKPMRLCGPQQSVPRLTVTEASTALSLCVVLALSPGLLPLCCGLAETQAMSCSHDPLFFTVTNGAAATASWHTCDHRGRLHNMPQ